MCQLDPMFQAALRCPGAPRCATPTTRSITAVSMSADSAGPRVDMAHLPSRTVSRWRSVFASVIETAFIESRGRRGLAHEVAAQLVDQPLQVRMLLRVPAVEQLA